MAHPSEDALATAVNALYRIRAVESPPDQEGLRSVWHQCAQGADLVSHVDAKGHVVRQELTLLDDYFRWTSQHGLITGETAELSGKVSLKASSDVHLDPAISAERVLRAATALGSYKGEDRYIRNIQRVLNLVRTGLQSYEEITVTRSFNGPAVPIAAAPPKKSPALLAGVIAVLLIAAAVGVAVVLLRT